VAATPLMRGDKRRKIVRDYFVTMMNIGMLNKLVYEATKTNPLRKYFAIFTA